MTEELQQVEAALSTLLAFVERSRFGMCQSPTWSEAVAAAAVTGPEALLRLRATIVARERREAPETVLEAA